MGNTHNDPDSFDSNDWIEVNELSSTNVTLWENKNNANIHLEEHKLYAIDSSELDH